MQTRSTWQSERAAILQRICTGVERRLQCRPGVRRAVRVYAWRYRNRRYKSDSSRRVRLSRKSLVDLFYEWKRLGRTPDAFTLKYRKSQSKIPARMVNDFIRLCGEPGIYSLSAAYRKLTVMWRDGQMKRPFKFRRRADFPFAFSTVCRALTAEQRHAIIELQQAEQAVELAREKFNRLLTD